MGAEVVLFIIVAIVAIGAAAAMLASENAVHSALFLILNFACVAFLYLLLEAPFLAMIQIAVYAGAIMVLFLFVIMLLGAEKLPEGEKTRELRWLGPLGLTLASAFLIAAAWGLSQGGIDTQQPPPGQALVRFVNAAPENAEVPSGEGVNPALVALAQRNFDVYVNGTLVDSGVRFGEATSYAAYNPGDLAVTFSPTGTQVPFVTGTIPVSPDGLVTIVLHGASDSALTLTPVVSEAAPVGRNTGRVLVFNALPEPQAVTVIDLESELFNDSRKFETILADLPYGQASQPLDLSSGEQDWTVIEAGSEAVVRGGETRPVLLRLDGTLDIAPESAHLLVIAGDRTIDGADNPLRPVAFDLPESASYAYGSPQAVGIELFTTYILPLQLVAVLLLASMIGVIVLTVREEHTPKPNRALRRKVSRPLTSVIATQTGSDLTSGAPQLEAPKEAASEQSPEPVGD